MRSRPVKLSVLALLLTLVATAGPVAALEPNAAFDEADEQIDVVLAEAGVDDPTALTEEQAAIYAACLSTFGGTGAGVVVCSLFFAAGIYNCAQISNRFKRSLCYISW